LRRTAEYSLLDHTKNEDISNDSIEKKVAQYKYNWLNNIKRMENIAYTQYYLDSRPIGKEYLDDY
jgi:hypothetical protein